MKKFGLGKKEKADDGEDSSRSRLFGSKSSKPKAAASASDNPYATPQAASASDPYAYSASRPSYASSSQPPAYDQRGHSSSSRDQSPYAAGGARTEKSPVPPGGYGGSGGRFNSTGSYGAQQGYGSNPYGANSDQASLASSTMTTNTLRPGGYGGLGRQPSSETLATDAGREALFGGAKERVQQRQVQDGPAAQDQQAGEGSNPHSSYGVGGEGDAGGYGTYQDRQLTAEEEEEEDVKATKDQIRTIKREDVSSTRNALRIAAQAEQTGRETLERLGAQGERIHNTEKNLDLADNQNRLAEEKAKELKHLNRSMWAMHVNNPFTKSAREQQRDEAILTQHQMEKQQRDATRAAAYATYNRHQETGRDLRGAPGNKAKKSNLAERSKYQFEADSEDEAMEEEIDSNLEQLTGVAGRLNQLGRAMGKEVDSQNVHIDRIVGKADRVDDHIHMNRSRLDRIK